MRSTSAADLRKAISRVSRGRKAQGRRYESDLRRRVVAYAVAARSQGASVASTAAELGLSYATLRAWVQSQPKGFRAVALKTASREDDAGRLQLVTAQGHRVEGLNREDVAFLLRTLT